MFNEETCDRCGICLAECPFMELPIDEAQKEIQKIIDGGQSDTVINGCASCGFCNGLCPTESNPFSLMREVLLKSNAEEGVGGLFLISEEVPFNLFSMAMDFENQDKKSILERYSNPSGNAEMFYSGCALPKLFPDLTKTRLLERYPVVGGTKYCCGASVFGSFGVDEARIRGLKLLDDFKKLDIFITTVLVDPASFD